MTHDFWKSAGLHLVERRDDGWLVPTPDYIRAYLTRPEVHPIDTSCDKEVALHEALMEAPDMLVDMARLAQLGDQDVAENYAAVLAFRDVILGAPTLEEAYLNLARSSQISVPPVFVEQLIHLILRNALRDVTDPMQLRAAEIFFREQSVSIDEGRLMLADEEIVTMRTAAGQETGLAQLLAQTATPMRQVTLDVLGEENSSIYWDRSDRFDTVVDFRFGQPAPDAFARVVETWLAHLLRMKVAVEPRPEVKDKDWRWHIGLDAAANTILNALYEGRDPGLEALARIICLFRMRIRDEDRVIDRVRGQPIYLGLAMTDKNILRMKPQNLIANLPLRALS